MKRSARVWRGKNGIKYVGVLAAWYLQKEPLSINWERSHETQREKRSSAEK